MKRKIRLLIVDDHPVFRRGLLEFIGESSRFKIVGEASDGVAALRLAKELKPDIAVVDIDMPQNVEAALLDVFSNRVLSGGQLGFFHPDNLTFGEGIYLSKIVAAAQAVTGVQSVSVTTFQRLFEPANNEFTTGVLALASNEIARLDNDPNFPEHGSLTLNLRGGR